MLNEQHSESGPCEQPADLRSIANVEEQLLQAVRNSPAISAFLHDGQAGGRSVQQSRCLLRVSSEALPNHLTASTLAGVSRISVPPQIFFDDANGSLIAAYHLGLELSGHVGLIHGGFLAVVLDECMGRACFARLPERIGVTVHMEIDYRKPVKADSMILVRAVTERVEGRKAWVKGTVMSLGDVAEEVLVEAHALFIQPKWASSMEQIM
ncbi:thioesterase family protein [Exophiala viscosa]|uniref:Thioesterase family protein n=1 Tax=Exophiala viscosa TaxID=2486360 RepID=A0AAN6IF46_9EURO|nr:thioesterase family protein [Exophiala viscosa]